MKRGFSATTELVERFMMVSVNNPYTYVQPFLKIAVLAVADRMQNCLGPLASVVC